MRVNEGKLATVMICNPRQIFGGLLTIQSIVFYFGHPQHPKFITQKFTLHCHLIRNCWAMKRDLVCCSVNSLDFCESSDIGVTICVAWMMVTEDILGAGVTLHLILLFGVIYYYHNAPSHSVDMLYFLLIWFLFH